MPRYHLTFDYPGHKGETVAGRQAVVRGSLEDAAEYIAAQRGLASIHIRERWLDDGSTEAVDREFTFAPSAKSEAA